MKLTKKAALRLENISGEFTMGIREDEATNFIKNFPDMVQKLAEDGTPDAVLNAYKAKFELAVAYEKVAKALDILKGEII